MSDYGLTRTYFWIRRGRGSPPVNVPFAIDRYELGTGSTARVARIAPQVENDYFSGPGRRG